MKRIFHITSQREASSARQHAEYAPQNFKEEGFIHCSFVGQLLDVAERHFQYRTDLVVLEIDPAKLGCAVVEENLEGGRELYPHIYGRLRMSAVGAAYEFPGNGQGGFDLPEALR